eukprot:gene7797-9146_t
MWIVIFPLFWYRYKNGKVFYTIPPLLWVSAKDDEHLKVVLLPLGVFSKSRSGWWFNIAFIIHLMVRDSSSYFHLLPLLFVRTKNDKVDVNIMAVIHYKKRSDSFLFTFMLLFWITSKNSALSVLLLPLFIYRRTSSKTLFILAFLFYYFKSASTTFSMLPLAYWYRKTSSSTIVNVALLATYRRLDTAKLYLLFPFLWVRSLPGSFFSVHVWPVLGVKVSQKSKGFNIYSLYPAIIYKNKRNGLYKRFMFLGVIAQYLNDKENHIKRHSILPVYFTSTTPSYTRGLEDGTYGSTPTPPPLDDDGNFVPRPRYKTETATDYSFNVYGLLPLIFYVTRGPTNKLLIIMPLFVTKWCSDRRDSYFASPIYYQRLTEFSLVRWLLPVFFQRRTLTKSLILSPVFIHWRKDGNSVRIVPPLYIDVVKGETHLILVLLPTFIHYRKSIFKFTSLFPFFYRSQDASKGSLFTYIFPFYGYSTKGASSSNYYVLFPLFGYHSDPEVSTKSVDVLFPLFHYDRSETSYSLRLLPFFWRSVNPNNAFLLVMPLFWRFITNREKRPQITTLFLPCYFKRDSAEYLLTFASPALLPPYYIHYHRESSQIEETYVFPFFAHKIRGLDHLRWVLLVLYRHSWRDFSDNMYMNVLLYFKYVSDDYNISGIVPLWVKWLCKKQDKFHLRILLLLAYDRLSSTIKKTKRISFFWLVSNRVSMFTYRHSTIANVVSDFITRPSDAELYPTNTPADNDRPTTTFTKSSTKSFALLWIGSPAISMYRYYRDTTVMLNRLFPVFYRYTDSSPSLEASGFSFLWIGHPDVALFRTYSSVRKSIVSLFPLFWRKESTVNKTYQLSILYVVRRYGLIDYLAKEQGDTFRFYIFPMCHVRHSPSETRISILYAGHSRASMFSGYFTEDSSKFWIVPWFWYSFDRKEERSNLSLFWIVDPRVSFIGHWTHGEQAHFHILFLIWVSAAEEYYQWGLFWIAWAKSSVGSNPFLNQGGNSTKISSIYYPVSLFMFYNDGAHRSHHLMPVYRYTSKSKEESEKLWALFGMIYLYTRQDIVEFRWFYRWIRVKSSESTYICEINPFVSYKRKGQETKLLFIG